MSKRVTAKSLREEYGITEEPWVMLNTWRCYWCKDMGHCPSAVDGMDGFHHTASYPDKERYDYCLDAMRE